jgi:hypothetical protein
VGVALLADLQALPPHEGHEAEPYFSLWSAQCHQGDVYAASYAAVPHMASAIARAPERAPWSLFQMPACIEIARVNGHGPEIPAEVQADYFAALGRVPELVARAAAADWDRWCCAAALSALAASKGFATMAEAVLELDPDTIEDMLRRKFGEDSA